MNEITVSSAGTFVALCWTDQIYKHTADSKPSYVAD
ncbi:hypothetical protein BJ987_004395 [Nocardia goodfellowii]|uniref:Uncharacterized protein n=1 Tax=Nocardia goodfellowii TaxID=882446 RepID=A0ABS4QIG7_9NOCA|nr:hypothetical protein [Nocardia goodfellowii]